MDCDYDFDNWWKGFAAEHYAYSNIPTEQIEHARLIARYAWEASISAREEAQRQFDIDSRWDD